MTIQKDIKELNLIQVDIKNLQAKLRDLKQHKIKCENRIIEYLNNNNMPGLKGEDHSFVIEESNRCKQNNKKEKCKKGKEILQKHGIRADENLVEELLTGVRGSPQKRLYLKMINSS